MVEPRDRLASIANDVGPDLLFARQIIARRAVIGGEGNGGVMYPAAHVGRDAPVAAALILALLARERVPVSELVAGAEAPA